MMDLLLATSGSEAQAASGGYVDDVFSAYTYTGNGSTQTINNGIDLAGKGGLVWCKSRSGAGNNVFVDTDRGAGKALSSNRSLEETAVQVDLQAFNPNGFYLSGNSDANYSGYTCISWTFRKAPKFFDVVTYTGTNSSGTTGVVRAIAHSLGVTPGMIVVKRVDSTGDWQVWHSGISANQRLKLNLADAQSGGTDYFGDGFGTTVNPTPSTFTVGTNNNLLGATYIAYLFAHDPSAEGIIQCGSYVGNATIPNFVNLGWEPQYVLIKNTSSTGNWTVFDAQRGMPVNGVDLYLSPNTSAAEVTSPDDCIYPTATGFALNTNAAIVNNSGNTYIYLAIRRPNKPPTSGTEVYNAIVRTGTGAAATVTGVGFAPDLVHSQDRVQQLAGSAFYDRLRGGAARLLTTRTDAEFIDGTQIRSFNMDGYTAGVDTVPYPAINSPSVTYINHFFRRAAGFMDMVCYTGTGVARTVPHNLGVAPELMIVKMRTGASAWAWYVYSAPTGAGNVMYLNEVYAASSSSTWDNAAPSASAITLSTANGVNQSGTTYVAYLFASLPGISKVGSYTGNGSSQTINCGFSTGSRFILVKRTDATGDWYVWDSVRGIIAANDPHLRLNTAAPEVTTDDSVDPDASGFIVNQNTATNINVNGGQYIFLAIA